jgi:hypothetical protein
MIKPHYTNPTNITNKAGPHILITLIYTLPVNLKLKLLGLLGLLRLLRLSGSLGLFRVIMVIGTRRQNTTFTTHVIGDGNCFSVAACRRFNADKVSCPEESIFDSPVSQSQMQDTGAESMKKMNKLFNIS